MERLKVALKSSRWFISPFVLLGILFTLRSLRAHSNHIGVEAGIVIYFSLLLCTLFILGSYFLYLFLEKGVGRVRAVLVSFIWMLLLGAIITYILMLLIRSLNINPRATGDGLGILGLAVLGMYVFPFFVVLFLARSIYVARGFSTVETNPIPVETPVLKFFTYGTFIFTLIFLVYSGFILLYSARLLGIPGAYTINTNQVGTNPEIQNPPSELYPPSSPQPTGSVGTGENLSLKKIDFDKNAFPTEFSSFENFRSQPKIGLHKDDVLRAAVYGFDVETKDLPGCIWEEGNNCLGFDVRQPKIGYTEYAITVFLDQNRYVVSVKGVEK